MLKLVQVNSTNRHLVNKIKGKKDQLHLVHYNAHWYGQSQLKDDIHFFLVQSTEDDIGVICFGQYYKDDYLQDKEPDTGEIIHIVVDARHQGNGYSKQMAALAITKLKEQGYAKIVVAIAEDNVISQSLWKKLGFKETDQKNYDGDPVYEWIELV